MISVSLSEKDPPKRWEVFGNKRETSLSNSYSEVWELGSLKSLECLNVDFEG
jgi:hypothetical protein